MLLRWQPYPIPFVVHTLHTPTDYTHACLLTILLSALVHACSSPGDHYPVLRRALGRSLSIALMFVMMSCDWGLNACIVVGCTLAHVMERAHTRTPESCRPLLEIRATDAWTHP